MNRKRTAVFTIPGILSYYLDELDLRRKDLADMLRTSVRTIHNIEHGRKPVSNHLLSSLAATLNKLWADKYPAANPIDLGADSFLADPTSLAGLVLRSVATNRPELLTAGDSSVVTDDMTWNAPGSPTHIPFAGTYGVNSLDVLMDKLHRSLRDLRLEDAKILTEPSKRLVLLRAIMHARHPVTRMPVTFRGYSEVSVTSTKVLKIDSMIEVDLLSRFFQDGVAPRNGSIF